MIWTIFAGVGAVVVGLALLGMGSVALLVYVRRSLPTATAPGAATEALSSRVAALEVKVEGLPSLWEDERARSKRAQDAARKARSDAQEKLEEVEALADEIRGGDEDGGQEDRVQLMLPRLGGPTTPGVDERVAAVAHLLR